MREARKFVNSLPMLARKKVYNNIKRIVGGERNAEIFKKIESTDLWEFRTLYNGVAYRLFAFWDTERAALIVATHGIIKKSQKTPKKDIEKAERLRNEYLEDKKKGL